MKKPPFEHFIGALEHIQKNKLVDRESLDIAVQSLGQIIGTFLHENLHFALALVTVGESGHASYVTSGERTDMVKVLLEMAKVIARGLDSKPGQPLKEWKIPDKYLYLGIHRYVDPGHTRLKVYAATRAAQPGGPPTRALCGELVFRTDEAAGFLQMLEYAAKSELFAPHVYLYLYDGDEVIPL